MTRNKFLMESVYSYIHFVLEYTHCVISDSFLSRCSRSTCKSSFCPKTKRERDESRLVPSAIRYELQKVANVYDVLAHSRRIEEKVEDDRLHLPHLPTTATSSALPPAHTESLIRKMDATSRHLPPQSLIDAMRNAKKPRRFPQDRHPSTPQLDLSLLFQPAAPDPRPGLAPAERPARLPHHLRQSVLWRRGHPADSSILKRHSSRRDVPLYLGCRQRQLLFTAPSLAFLLTAMKGGNSVASQKNEV